MKAISIRQPWLHAILSDLLNKRIENRSRADGHMPSVCRHRGPLLLHASKAMTVQEYVDAQDFMRTIGCSGPAFSHFRIPYPAGTPMGDLERQGGSSHMMAGIVGVASVIAHVDPKGRCWLDPDGKEEDPELLDEMKARQWHIPGSYGLVLGEPREVPYTPWSGALGLFDVPDSVALPLIARAA